MNAMFRIVSLSATLAIVAIGGPGLSRPARGDDTKGREIPAAFSSLEYLVGKWKGQAVPKDSPQSFRGWPESHTWAWIFTKGKPTGLSLSITGGKILADGKLTFDAAQGRYRLEGTRPKPEGGPIAFAGAIDASGKMLVLEQVGHDSAGGQPRGTIRVSLRPNANFIRYTMWVNRKEPGDVQFSRSIEVGLTKEGESLAAGTSSSERPKCIVTGGAATMSLTYQGRTFLICCTGCRDEFNENPEKYIKKASLMAQAEGSRSKAAGLSPARVSRSEDAFAADVDDTPAMKTKRPPAGTGTQSARADSPSSSDDDAATAAGTGKPSTRKAEQKTASSQLSTRAAGLLQIGQNLEKSGKNSAGAGLLQADRQGLCRHARREDG